jgi:NADPH:quinone reductase-like Zn-dependent oxidoreductase
VGSDVSGVVDQVGLGVSEFAVGDEVLGSSVTPSFAEYALAEPANLVRKPDGIAWEVAGSLAGSGGTAYAVLKRLRLKAGETLLIHAAAGGVGTFAVQLAVARGVTVIGTAGERNHDYLRSIGAIPVTYGDGLLERVRSVAPQGVDAVLDASGRGEIPMSIQLTGKPNASSRWSHSTPRTPASRFTLTVQAAISAMLFVKSSDSSNNGGSRCRSREPFPSPRLPRHSRQAAQDMSPARLSCCPK